MTTLTNNNEQEATTDGLKKYIIYEIRPFNRDIIYSYIGSTLNFRSRKNQHNTTCNNENSKGYNLNIYQFIRGNGGFDAFEMIPLEIYECENKMQSRIREQIFINQLEIKKLNMRRAYRSENELKEYQQEYQKEYQQEYYENNKEKIKEYQQENQDKIKKIKIKKYYVVVVNILISQIN